MIDNLIYLAAILLLPLVPALLIYKFLPSRTSVSGPFKGLSIQLQGAFAGFFLLVLISIGLITYLLQTQGRSIEYHYYLKFPGEDFQGDIGRSKVTVRLRKHGTEKFLNHDLENYSIKKIMESIMVTVKNVNQDDTLYVNVELDDQKWESNSAIVPVGQLDMSLGNNRDLFDR